MLPYLSRVSLWLAALAAAASLFTSGREGAALATIAIVALMGALVLRRFQWKVCGAQDIEFDDVVALNDAALLEVATLLSHRISHASTLLEALSEARNELIHELGARGVVIHGPTGDTAPLTLAERFPLGEALRSGEITGNVACGYAAPVVREGRVVAVLELQGIELAVDPQALVRLLDLVKVQLEAVALRDAFISPGQDQDDRDTARWESTRGAIDLLDPPPLGKEGELLNVLAENLPISLFVFEPGEYRLLALNRHAEQEFALKRQDIIGKTLRESFNPHLVERVEPAMRQAILEKTTVDVDSEWTSRKLGRRTVNVRNVALHDADGLPQFVLAIAREVTAERRNHHELETARDMAEAASRAKSQFVANMSHEIRTPMNGILGMTELLLGTPLNDRQRRFAKAVYRSGESLLEIINDILDFSKIEAGKLELAPTDFSLRSVVEDTLELLAPRAHEKGLELSFHEAPSLPAMVHGDPLRVRQVLTNLIANAIKFTEHGEVVIELKPASEDARGLDQRSIVVRFNVRDTGIGIDADTLPRLFTSFTQASNGMSRRYGGTGLGLAISKQLIELMGGSIRVDSQLGVGSQFSFDLPLLPAASNSALMELDETELGTLRVLVVEDHETNRMVLENMLDAWGMDVTLAEDGQQALDILRCKTVLDSHYDLALVDMKMPRMDGLSLGRALQADGSHPDMKMILLSSVSSPDDVRSAQLAGFHRFVAKPVRRAELRQAILGVTSQRRDPLLALSPLQGHVLVVEDNPVNQEVIGQMLRHLGLNVRVAAGALQGLQALCEAHFDLVLMDIQMPGMDGVEALSWFRQGTSGRFTFMTPSHTPVIAVTANALGGDEDRFLNLGFDDYLSKPFRQSQLIAMLTKRLSPRSRMPTDGNPQQGAENPARSGAADSVLDASALERLRELDPKGESQLLSRVVKAFESSAARLMPQLQDASRSGDNAGVRHVAHTLKSSSASIGAIKLSQLCAEIETNIRSGRVDNLEELVVTMAAEVEIVLQALKRLLDVKT